MFYENRIKYSIYVWLVSVTTILAGAYTVADTDIGRVVMLLSLPLVVEFFIIHTSWFLARAIHLSADNFIVFTVYHAASALVFTVLLDLMVFVNAQLLALSEPDVLWEDLFYDILPFLIFTGLILYVLVMLCNYLILNLSERFEQEKKLIKSDLHLSKSELNVLRSAVHPHFLFNSFNTLTSLIETGNKEAGNFCRGLSDFLRYSLRYSERELVSLQEELVNLNNYLDIEKIRMGERLRVELNFQDELLDCLIPPFSIITFAENGIKHGISNYIEGGLLQLEAALVEEQLVIKVFNPVKPDDCLQRQGEGLGISNLKKRLFLIFKRDACVSLKEGETVFLSELRLPVLRKR